MIPDQAGASSGSLEAAIEHAELGLPVPKGASWRFLKRLIARLNRPFMYRQITFNRAVVAELARLDDLRVQLGLRIDTGLDGVYGQVAQFGPRLDDLRVQLGLRIDTGLDGVYGQVSLLGPRIDSGLDDLREQIAQFGPRIDLVQRQAVTREHEALAALRDELVELGAQVQEALTAAERAGADLTRVSQATDTVQAQLEERTDAVGAQVQELAGATDARVRELADATDARVRELADAVSGMGAHSERDRSEARIRQAQVDLFLTEVRRSFPAPPDAQRLSRLPSPVDNMYVALEDAFRGSTEVIKERAREYLDDVLALTRKGPVVDVGCGRGEWLEVLKESGVDAYGIDLNPQFVGGCMARGLDVRLADALQHLADVPERSLAAVTALHVAEHLPIEALVELVDLSVRALQPGGLLILETPNPDSLVVGASTFYIDPGHIRPLNPRYLAFLVGARGLADVEVRYKHPADDGLPVPDRERPWAVDLLPVVEAVNHRIFGPLDYAVLGRRV
jgi:2-polyprenyl-3-methyl-5-hydroxy-6-metoxy-1,4-benzoquinol methylase